MAKAPCNSSQKSDHTLGEILKSLSKLRADNQQTIRKMNSLETAIKLMQEQRKRNGQ